MKHFLQHLLITFSLCLCALIAFQWVRETALRKQVQGLTDTVHDKLEAIQGLEGTKRRNESEIQRLDALKNDLNNTIKSNQAHIVTLNKDLEKANNEIDRHEKQIEVYKVNLEKANQTAISQNEIITTLNGEMKKLAEDRNEFVNKLNKLATDYKELAERWNKQQEDLQKASTNAPAKK